MLQVRGGLDLFQESLGAEDGGEFGTEDLEGDFAVVAEVVREIDRGHAALTEFAVEAVAVGEGRGERFRRGHERVEVSAERLELAAEAAARPMSLK